MNSVQVFREIRSDLSPRRRTVCAAPGMLLRKEVIQPHLPVRLPCYDFIPITYHTFGTFLPAKAGLDQRLRVQ